MNTMVNHKQTSRRYGWFILAVALMALAGCSGDSTSPTSPDDTRAAVDTAPPAVPTGLSAAAIDAQVKVAWLPNTTDPDVAGYLVYRVAFDQVWPLLSAPTLDTYFFDESPLTRPCKYAVTAIDEAGNESAWMQVHFQGVPDRPELSLD